MANDIGIVHLIPFLTSILDAVFKAKHKKVSFCSLNEQVVRTKYLFHNMNSCCCNFDISELMIKEVCIYNLNVLKILWDSGCCFFNFCQRT